MARKIFFLSIFMFLVGVSSVSVSYAQCPVCAKAAASNGNWPERSMCQLAQGSANLLFGWTEAFAQPLRENSTNPNPDGGYKTLNGVLKGWGQAVITSGAGLMEALTFWTPVRIVPNTNCVGCNDIGQEAGKCADKTGQAAAHAGETLFNAGASVGNGIDNVVTGAGQSIEKVLPKH